MGWETRAGSSYYYRKRRIGHRVVSEYCGHGHVAEMIAALDAEEREERTALRAERERMQEREKAVDAKIREVCDTVRALTTAVLLLLGYHMHKGQWRKTRDGAE